MTEDPDRNLAILDACVLVNAALRDTFLRLAEPPCLYLARRSREIIAETARTLETKLGLSSKQAVYLESELRTHFAEAWIEDYEKLVPAMQNHPKDRHVLAAAVRSGARTIVTFNRKDFPADALDPWGVKALSPDEFLVRQFRQAPEIVLRKLKEQAERHGGMQRLVEIHSRTCPTFVALIGESLKTSNLLI